MLPRTPTATSATSYGGTNSFHNVSTTYPHSTVEDHHSINNALLSPEVGGDHDPVAVRLEGGDGGWFYRPRVPILSSGKVLLLPKPTLAAHNGRMMMEREWANMKPEHR